MTITAFDHVGAGDISILSGTRQTGDMQADFIIRPCDDATVLARYHRLRHQNFVDEQGLFAGTDRDDIDDDPRQVVLAAIATCGTVLGGVRLAPVGENDLGWWTGSRLVVGRHRRSDGVGEALIRAACAYAESVGVLRFDATVQLRHRPLFARLGWEDCGPRQLGGVEHVQMRWPIDRIQRAVDATKSFLGPLLAPLRQQSGGLGPPGFRGDDGVPVPGADLVAACDAIVPAMVQRDPHWAGWCSVLVNINDLTAMGATPTALLDAVGAPTHSILTRVIRGIAQAADAWGVPVLGGHTQVGVPAALAVTALGATARPIAASAGRVGDDISVTADLKGRWRAGYYGRQWDSTSYRDPAELRQLAGAVAAAEPAAAKDVSMAGMVGTLGMLAEASSTGAELEVAAIPRPTGADAGSWLTCFPGYAMLTADRPQARMRPVPLPVDVRSARCGRLTSTPGVRLRWPDGVSTRAARGAVTGLGHG